MDQLRLKQNVYYFRVLIPILLSYLFFPLINWHFEKHKYFHWFGGQYSIRYFIIIIKACILEIYDNEFLITINFSVIGKQLLILNEFEFQKNSKTKNGIKLSCTTVNRWLNNTNTMYLLNLKISYLFIWYVDNFYWYTFFYKYPVM